MNYKYNVFNFDLTAGLNEEITIQGGFIYIKDATDISVAVGIRPDLKSNDIVSLKKQFGLILNFNKLFVTAPAQPGKSVSILVTNSFEMFRIYEQAQLTDIGSVTSITNDVNENLKSVGGTIQTGRDISLDSQALRKNKDAEQGVQVAKSNGASGATTIIHTVTSGKTLFLEAATCSTHSSPTGYHSASLFIRDLSDVTTCTVMDLTCYGDINNSLSFPVALLIPAGFDICLSAPSQYAFGFIKGREI